jgi:adenosine deaminase
MVRWSGRGRIFTILVCLVAWNTASADERAAARVYEKLLASNGLEAFFRAFPKGGDLHNHMGGGITPQQWMDIAIKRNFCVDERLPALVQNLESACPA